MTFLYITSIPTASYAVQVIFKVVDLESGFYESKKQFAREMIPFMWIYDGIIKLTNTYKDLD